MDKVALITNLFYRLIYISYILLDSNSLITFYPQEQVPNRTLLNWRKKTKWILINSKISKD